MNNFESELIDSDMMNRLVTSPLADLNSNYSIIHKIIEDARQKHIVTKKVKFNKRKHKKSKWITF